MWLSNPTNNDGMLMKSLVRKPPHEFNRVELSPKPRSKFSNLIEFESHLNGSASQELARQYGSYNSRMNLLIQVPLILSL